VSSSYPIIRLAGLRVTTETLETSNFQVTCFIALVIWSG
jgi:hypothetical protein